MALRDKITLQEDPLLDELESERVVQVKRNRPERLARMIRREIERFAEPPPGDAQKNEVTRVLTRLVRRLVRRELNDDPEARGYAAASDAQKVVLLCEAWTDPVTGEFNNPRLCTVIQNVPFGPNQLDAADIAEITNGAP